MQLSSSSSYFPFAALGWAWCSPPAGSWFLVSPFLHKYITFLYILYQLSSVGLFLPGKGPSIWHVREAGRAFYSLLIYSWGFGELLPSWVSKALFFYPDLSFPKYQGSEVATLNILTPFKSVIWCLHLLITQVCCLLKVALVLSPHRIIYFLRGEGFYCRSNTSSFWKIQKIQVSKQRKIRIICNPTIQSQLAGLILVDFLTVFAHVHTFFPLEIGLLRTILC